MARRRFPHRGGFASTCVIGRVSVHLGWGGFGFDDRFELVWIHQSTPADIVVHLAVFSIGDDRGRVKGLRRSGGLKRLGWEVGPLTSGRVGNRVGVTWGMIVHALMG